jgi:hypothetical protein
VMPGAGPAARDSSPDVLRKPQTVPAQHRLAPLPFPPHAVTSLSAGATRPCSESPTAR